MYIPTSRFAFCRRGLIYLFFLTCSSVYAQFSEVDGGWQVKDVGTGIKPSFDFAPDGSIHVMGLTEALIGDVWHASAPSIDGPWEPDILAKGYYYGPGDLRVDAEGTAHLAYHDHDTENAAHIAVTPNSVRRTEMVTPISHDGWDNSLAIDSNGTVRMASIFPSQFGSIASLVMGSFDGGEWQSETLISSGGGMYGLNTSIDIDSTDRSHVAYTLANDWTGPGRVRYASQTATGWDIETIESGNNVGRFPSLAVDQNDQVHAAWVNINVANQQLADIRYGQRIGDEWQVETVAQLDAVQLGFTGARKLVSLAIDSSGNPHLAYGDRNSVSYATKNGVAWEETTVVATEANTLNGLVVLRLDSDDNPGITFWRPQAGPQQGIVSLAVASGAESILGDFNGDGQLTSQDIDLLSSAFGSSDLQFDMNADAQIDSTDHTIWITDVVKKLPGDANLDGNVDFQDFLALSANFLQPGGWAEGNFDGLMGVGFPDFLILSDNFNAVAAAAAVPEPMPVLRVQLLLGGAFVLLNRRRRTTVRKLGDRQMRTHPTRTHHKPATVTSLKFQWVRIHLPIALCSRRLR